MASDKPGAVSYKAVFEEFPSGQTSGGQPALPPKSAQDRIEGTVAPQNQHAVGIATGMASRPSGWPETRSMSLYQATRALAEPTFEAPSRLWRNTGSS